jgi:adenylate kinase
MIKKSTTFFYKNFTNQISKNFHQDIILMTGAPGVGKGTFSKMLSKDLKIPEFSTGDELRKIINSKDTDNQDQDQEISNIKKIVQEGKLVDDQTMLSLVKKRLHQKDTEKGIILDGYPRNLNQAKEFNKVSLVLDIFLADDILIPKMLGRRLCPCCGNNYNIFSMKENGYDMDPLFPKKSQNKCDDCNIELIERADDKESIIRERLEVYKKHTLPLTEFYEKQNILIRFEPKKGKKDYPLLKKIVDDFLEKNHKNKV